MTNTPTEASTTDDTSVDALAARVANRLKVQIDERAALRSKREEINHRLKWLDVEIDKAERMIKALVPKRRRSTSTNNGEVTP